MSLYLTNSGASLVLATGGIPVLGGTPLARNEHPRLGMALSDLSTIGTAVSTGGGWNTDFKTMVADVEAAWGDTSTTDINYLCYWTLAAGLVYQLRKANVVTISPTFASANADWLTKGVGWLMRFKDTSETWEHHAKVYLWYGYDWLHDGLSSGQRTELVQYSYDAADEFAATNSWLGRSAGQAWPTTGVGTRAYTQEIIWRGFSKIICTGLAAKGDNALGDNDAWVDKAIGYYVNDFDAVDGMRRRETQRGGTDGSAIQGWSTYGYDYNGNWLNTTDGAYRTALGISKATHYAAATAGYYHGYIKLANYWLRPKKYYGSWRFFKDIASNASTGPGQGLDNRPMFYFLSRELVGVDNDLSALAAWYVVNREGDTGSDRRRWPLKFLGPVVTAQSPTDIALPPSAESQSGYCQWRSNWTSESAAVVMVYYPEFSAGRSPVGTFTVDYLGPSIVVSGVGGHDPDGFNISGNYLAVPEGTRNANEGLGPQYDDYGGHRTYGYTVDLEQNTRGDWLDRTERYKADDATEDYGYLWLNRGRSMNGDVYWDGATTGCERKISSCYRSFATFLPASLGTDSCRVVVFDRVVKKDTKFQSRNMLYYAGTPSVDGSGAAGPARGVGPSTTGKTTYTGATLITATMTDGGSDNKTWVTPYCPSGAFSVVLVNSRRSNEFEDHYGLMHGTSGFSESEVGGLVGKYRTEVIPTSSSLSERFMTAIEVTPSAGSQSTTADWSGTNFDAVRIGNRVAACGTTEYDPDNSLGGTTSGTIICKTSGTYRLLISNLPASTARTLTKGANIGTVTHLLTSDTDLTYTADANGCLYLEVVVSFSDTGADNTLTVS